MKIEDKSFKLYMHIFPNNKVYIGITKYKVEYRWNSGKGYQRQPYIYKAILKYGWDNIEHIVLLDGLTEKQAKQKEKEYIKFYKSNDKNYGYNLTDGGDGTVGATYSQIRNEKLSNSLKGHIVKIETREKLRQFNLGRKATEETKKKMSMKRKGENNSFYGKRHTQETKMKISQMRSGFNNKKSIQIGKYNDNLELIKIYGSLRQAEQDGYKRRKYENILDDENYISCGGYLWKKI